MEFASSILSVVSEIIYRILSSDVLSSLAIIITAYFGYNQYTKNKETDHRLKTIKEEAQQKAKADSENIGQTYGLLWNFLYKHEFDRVYILRPHPEKKYEFVSVQIEVRRNGISSIKKSLQNQPMDEIPHFVGRLSKEDYIIIEDTNNEKDIQDNVMRSMFSCNGSTCGVINRMENRDGRWCGNIFATCMHKKDLNDQEIKKDMLEISSKVQFILPDFI